MSNSDSKPCDVDTVFQTLHARERAELSEDGALALLERVILKNLEELGIPPNIQNCCQIANHITAVLLPDEPLSRWVIESIKSGSLPVYSHSKAEDHGIERGVAVILLGISRCSRVDVPHDAASRLLRRIEELGHLPEPEEIRE